MINESNDTPTSGAVTKQVIMIVPGVTSGMTSSIMRLARRLQLELVIQEVAERELERMRAEGRGLNALMVDDVPVLRSRDWKDWDNVQLSASCALYESRNIALVQARRDCRHGLLASACVRRNRQSMNVGWKRLSTRTHTRHERIRPKLGSVVVEPSSASSPRYYPASHNSKAGCGQQPTLVRVN